MRLAGRGTLRGNDPPEVGCRLAPVCLSPRLSHAAGQAGTAPWAVPQPLSGLGFLAVVLPKFSRIVSLPSLFTWTVLSKLDLQDCSLRLWALHS